MLMRTEFDETTNQVIAHECGAATIEEAGAWAGKGSPLKKKKETDYSKHGTALTAIWEMREVDLKMSSTWRKPLAKSQLMLIQ